MVFVEKNGVKTQFKAKELLKSMQDKGIKKDVAEHVAFTVGSKLSRTPVISSKDLQKLVYDTLEKENKDLAEQYAKD